MAAKNSPTTPNTPESGFLRRMSDMYGDQDAETPINVPAQRPSHQVLGNSQRVRREPNYHNHRLAPQRLTATQSRAYVMKMRSARTMHFLITKPPPPSSGRSKTPSPPTARRGRSDNDSASSRAHRSRTPGPKGRDLPANYPATCKIFLKYDAKSGNTPQPPPRNDDIESLHQSAMQQTKADPADNPNGLSDNTASRLPTASHRKKKKKHFSYKVRQFSTRSYPIDDPSDSSANASSSVTHNPTATPLTLTSTASMSTNASTDGPRGLVSPTASLRIKLPQNPHPPPLAELARSRLSRRRKAFNRQMSKDCEKGDQVMDDIIMEMSASPAPAPTLHDNNDAEVQSQNSATPQPTSQCLQSDVAKVMSVTSTHDVNGDKCAHGPPKTPQNTPYDLSSDKERKSVAHIEPQTLTSALLEVQSVAVMAMDVSSSKPGRMESSSEPGPDLSVSEGPSSGDDPQEMM